MCIYFSDDNFANKTFIYTISTKNIGFILHFLVKTNCKMLHIYSIYDKILICYKIIDGEGWVGNG